MFYAPVQIKSYLFNSIICDSFLITQNNKNFI